ncbi:MAG TPA: hypothetical protein VNA04_07490 [Thermoanaerobaculia bacterium]|nr:hypothetical protein [Thermoanaerobaculia bacterium]
MKQAHLIAAALLAVTLFAGCARERGYDESDSFSFIVYPGSRYLGELTEITRQAHKLVKPNEEPPPVAVYDTDASVEEVAAFYARSYGYSTVAPDVTNNLSATTPPAYYRTGDLAADVRSIQDQLTSLGLETDVSKADGTYRAAEIAYRPNRPRVTVQRPYFNVTTSEVVDRTIILMAR